MFVGAFFTRCRVWASLGTFLIGKPGASLLVTEESPVAFEWAGFGGRWRGVYKGGLTFFSGVHSRKLPLCEGSVRRGNFWLILDTTPIVTETPPHTVHFPLSRWSRLTVTHDKPSFQFEYLQLVPPAFPGASIRLFKICYPPIRRRVAYSSPYCRRCSIFGSICCDAYNILPRHGIADDGQCAHRVSCNLFAGF